MFTLKLLAVYLVLSLAAFVLSCAGTLLMRGLAPRLGLIDRPHFDRLSAFGGKRSHTNPKPLGGGVAIFLALWVTVWAGVAITALLTPPPAWLPEAVADLLPGIGDRLGRIVAIFLSGTFLAALSFLDDRYRIPGRLRLLAMMLTAAALVVARQEQITLFQANPWLTGAMTVAWVAGITTAFMVIDNMDGLCGGIAIIASLMFMVVAVQTQQFFLAALFAVLIGAVGGFLVFNFPPASIFMGDVGSITIGFMIAILSVDFTYYNHAAFAYHELFPVIVPLLILALPIFDIVLVMWIRLREGRSIFQGDTRHFSHRLVSLGMTRRQAVLTIYLVAAAVGLGATVLYQTNPTGAIVTLVQAAAVFAIIVLLERAGLKKEA